MTGFDETIHAPIRLRICAELARIDTEEFGVLRDRLEVTDSVLSKHLKVLVDAGYVTLDKPTGRGRVRTWAKLTTRGRAAFTGHVAALRELVAAPLEESSSPR